MLRNVKTMAQAAAAATLPPTAIARQTHLNDYLAKRPLPCLVLAITRNTNNNVVCFHAPLTNGRLHATTPVHSCWLEIDPEFMKRARAKGRTSDIVELTCYERMAFGFTTKPHASQTEATVTFGVLAKRPLRLRVMDGTPRLVGTIGGHTAIVSRIHADSYSRWGIPHVKGIYIMGFATPSGRPVIEYVPR